MQAWMQQGIPCQVGGQTMEEVLGCPAVARGLLTPHHSEAAALETFFKIRGVPITGYECKMYIKPFGFLTSLLNVIIHLPSTV
jgi:hypothetical protein